MTLYEDRACQVLKRLVKRRSRLTRLTWIDPLRGSCVSYMIMRGTKRSFWRLPQLTFEGSLAQNARSGDFRGSLWKDVSHKALVLETSAAHF